MGVSAMGARALLPTRRSGRRARALAGAIALLASGWPLASLGQSAAAPPRDAVATHGPASPQGGAPALGADLPRLLEYARSSSPELAAMRLDAAAAGERVEPAGALPDPRLRTELRDMTNGGTTPISVWPARVGSTKYLLMQEVPWFGKRDLKRGVAQAEYDAARHRSQESWATIAARIKTVFAQLYFVVENARLSRELMDLSAQLEAIVQSRYAGGLSVQQDVIRAQVERTNLRSELAMLEAERHHLSARMNSLLGRSVGSALAEPERLVELPAAATLEQAALMARLKESNPALLAEGAKLQAAERNRELVLRNRYPDFTVGFGPIQYGAEFKDWELMIELNIPFRTDTRAAQERESQAMLDAAARRREAAALQLGGELSENLVAIESARRIESLAADSLLPQAELMFRSALAGYETGKVDFATVLDAQRQIRQARLSRLKAQVDARVRLAEVERLLGVDQ